MMPGLDGKVVLITGGLGTIGFAAVTMFAARGARIVVNDITPAESHPGMAELQRRLAPDRLLFVEGDVSRERDVEEMYARIGDRFGSLDGTFHNAYTQIRLRVADYTFEQWRSVVNGTLDSTFLVCRGAIPLLAASGGGSMVNTSSVLGLRPRELDGAYGTAKAGVNHLTQVLAAENAHLGIRANAIVPGDIKEPTVSSGGTPRQPRAWLGRSGTPDEVSELASFLLSDASSYVTGSLYAVDGGFQV